jgi:putative tryptophan/tyrosine transport system substrate-binding protein
MRTIGFLHSGSRENFRDAWNAFRKMVPADVQIKDKYAKDDAGVLKKLAAELVNDPSIEVIVAAGGPQPALLLRDLTSTKSIVFTTVADPVLSGLVDRLDKPGRNLTGMAGQTSELDAERLQRLLEFAEAHLKPGDKIGVLVKEGRDHARDHLRKVEDKASEERFKVPLVHMEVSTVGGIEEAFESFKQEGVKGVVVTADSFFNNNRKEVVKQAAAKRIPTIYQWKEFVEEGGLVSYGPSLLEAYEMAGKIVTQILDGKTPATIPCSKPSRFELCVSKSAARELGLEVPKAVLGDEVRVIE